MRTKFKVKVGGWPFDHFVEDANGKVIAKLSMRNYSSKDKTLQDTLKHSEENTQVIKDANLLAAAPELLEALNNAIYIIETKCNGFGVNELKEAIKKATE